MTRQRITVLGATGSVGTNTLDVIARHPDHFEVFALGAARQVEPLLAQCAQFRPRFAVMADAAARYLSIADQSYWPGPLCNWPQVNTASEPIAPAVGYFAVKLVLRQS